MQTYCQELLCTQKCLSLYNIYNIHSVQNFQSVQYPECLVKTGDIDELGRKLESILLSKTRKNIVSSIANKYTTGEILSKLKVIYG